ncbi:GNAT family N-acetyltransferase [Paracoccus aurantiacus]|uniref:GNAT family N-acetyltransferase n=1 Tax=Paracoccus aurantiacus TaxID=2599412 RepID=A0A5C6S4P6_9RHOB|nr:GNAT family N-acetyltransferase [Paracoccus aurantiacus]
MAADTPLDRTFEASWPAAEYAVAGAFRIGRGEGGGMRVSSARLVSTEWNMDDIGQAIEIQRSWGQPPAFRLSEGQGIEAEDLRAALQSRGFRRHTPTRLLCADLGALTDTPVPRVTCFAVWPPLAIQRELWTEQGIGAARQAIMARVTLPKVALLGRIEDRAAAVGFVAAGESLAILHALEVLPSLRRKGLARWMLREAAFWAAGQGCDTLALAVTSENAPALSLYDEMGFRDIGGYSYFVH